MDNAGTVIRQQMDTTLAGLTGKLGDLEHQVSATVRTVKDSVNTVRDTLDLKLHVRRRPWTLMAGAAALGFLGGFRSSNSGAGRPTRNGRSDSTPPARVAAAEHQYSGAKDATNGADTARPTAAPAPSWLANLGDTFQPEIAELKGIVLGALLELVREIVTKQVSRPMERSVGDANHGSNGKLGESIRTGPPLSDTADV